MSPFCIEVQYKCSNTAHAFMSKRVLMIGWDFPPQTMGGLGVACKGLTDALIADGYDITFVLPKQQPVDTTMPVIFCSVPDFFSKDGWHGPYVSSLRVDGDMPLTHSWNKLIDESKVYAHQIQEQVCDTDFDVIHAHDWVSYLAGVAVKRRTKKPLILHVHALSFDQAASNHVDKEIYNIEHSAFVSADHIVAVSERTKRMIIEKFSIDASKISVVYNGTAASASDVQASLAVLRGHGYRVVLYHGRITIQKGPDYFIKAAKRVAEVNPYVLFVISGSGDMERQIVRETASLGLSGNVLFAGPLWGDERDSMYKTADVVVMPSVSEPFGIVPLEALMHGTPVIVSKQSGVAEILTHALKVDFWDVEELANKILCTLEYPALAHELIRHGKAEASAATWEKSVLRMKAIYKRVGRSPM